MLPAVAPSDTFGDAETQPDETENLAPHRAPETQWYWDFFYENFYAGEYERQRRRANRDRHLASRPWPLGGRVFNRDFQRCFALSVLLSRGPYLRLIDLLALGTTCSQRLEVIREPVLEIRRSLRDLRLYRTQRDWHWRGLKAFSKEIDRLEVELVALGVLSVRLPP